MGETYDFTVRRGVWRLMCASQLHGQDCEKEFDHEGVHRSWTGGLSWGTPAEVSDTLEGSTDG